MRTAYGRHLRLLESRRKKMARSDDLDSTYQPYRGKKTKHKICGCGKPIGFFHGACPTGGWHNAPLEKEKKGKMKTKFSFSGIMPDVWDGEKWVYQKPAKNITEYLAAWDAISAPICKATGVKLHSFDPSMAFVGDQNEYVQIPLWFAVRLANALRRRVD